MTDIIKTNMESDQEKENDVAHLREVALGFIGLKEVEIKAESASPTIEQNDWWRGNEKDFNEFVQLLPFADRNEHDYGKVEVAYGRSIAVTGLHYDQGELSYKDSRGKDHFHPSRLVLSTEEGDIDVSIGVKGIGSHVNNAQLRYLREGMPSRLRIIGYSNGAEMVYPFDIVDWLKFGGVYGTVKGEMRGLYNGRISKSAVSEPHGSHYDPEALHPLEKHVPLLVHRHANPPLKKSHIPPLAVYEEPDLSGLVKPNKDTVAPANEQHEKQEQIEGILNRTDTIERIITGETARDIAAETGVDPERVEALLDLIKDWSGAYLVETVVVNVKQPDNVYLAAVLPESVEGEMKEWAVADNPKSGNAIFIVNPHVVSKSGKDWRDILVEKTKGQAISEGAIRVIHAGNWKERVLELVTRPQ